MADNLRSPVCRVTQPYHKNRTADQHVHVELCPAHASRQKLCCIACKLVSSVSKCPAVRSLGITSSGHSKMLIEAYPCTTAAKRGLWNLFTSRQQSRRGGHISTSLTAYFLQLQHITETSSAMLSVLRTFLPDFESRTMPGTQDCSSYGHFMSTPIALCGWCFTLARLPAHGYTPACAVASSACAE